MKRAFLFLGLAISGLAVQAQDFKPAKGDITTEFGLTGGINSTNFTLNESATGGLLRFRYFQSEGLAYRLGFNVSSSSDKTNVYGPNDEKGTLTQSQTVFVVNLGVEKHFAGTERLSPYAGGDILIGAMSQKDKAEDYAGGAYAANTNSEVKGPGTFGFGLRGIVGADYYIAKHLFLGAEAGFGFLYAKEGETKTTASGTTTTVKSAGSNFALSPSVITGVRIGFVF
ncbi:hypothetical protein FW774_11705 [Pedobacter sp. BS3]|uniref:hypothetical protein n=1 Tax=Pedobacter sp. BS3 TaxID=2567937 RepID=UPI0011EBC49F|nr:hypothetical protein [Pedobacter sp. BS3]TZF84098.1 hypothetical protein FW774_11705 [Pedobacter sp. BS3]